MGQWTSNEVIKGMAALAALGALSACGGASTSTVTGGEFVGTPAAISSADVVDAVGFLGTVAGGRDTPNSEILPTGTATYTGHMITGLTIPGNSDVNGLIGDVEVTAELLFAGDDVTGSITGIHTLSGNTPVERLGGSLSITGELDDGTKEMDASYTGILDGSFGTGSVFNVKMSGDIDGDLQDTRTGTIPFTNIGIYDEATGIYGSIEGTLETLGDDDKYSETYGTLQNGTWAVSSN